MPPPLVPRRLKRGPFRGSEAVGAGLITRKQLRSTAWRRLFRDVYVWIGVPDDLRLRVAAVACPLVQYEVHGESGRFVARVDLAYPEWRIAIEYDGDHHRDHDTMARDAVRQNELVRLGWLVLRFTARDVYRRPEYVIETVRAAIARAS